MLSKAFADQKKASEKYSGSLPTWKAIAKWLLIDPIYG